MGRSALNGRVAAQYLELAAREGVDLAVLDDSRVTVSAREGIPDALIIFSDDPTSPEWLQGAAAAGSWRVPLVIFPSSASTRSHA